MFIIFESNYYYLLLLNDYLKITYFNFIWMETEKYFRVFVKQWTRKTNRC